MQIGKWRTNSWFLIYIMMFVPFGFIVNWAMLIPGIAFALLFGLEKNNAETESEKKSSVDTVHRRT